MGFIQSFDYGYDLLFSTIFEKGHGLAGHGGKDPGAVANGLQEKDLTLHLTVKAGAHLTSRYDCDVIYTRTKDVYLSPSERADIANEAGADLFCSFHIKSAANPTARGFETFKFSGAAGKTAMLQILVHGAAVKVTDRHEVLRYIGIMQEQMDDVVMRLEL